MVPEEKTFSGYVRTYSKSIISSLIILFLVVIFFVWFDHNKMNKKLLISEDFIDAKILLSEKSFGEALILFTEIISKKDKIYSPLSLFMVIDKDLEKDKNLVLEYFDTVLSINNLEDEDLDLLKLKKAIYISDNAKEEELLNLLNPIINSDSVWRSQSIKFIGDYYYSNKQFKKSKQYYSKLLTDENLNINLDDVERKMKLIENE